MATPGAWAGITGQANVSQTRTKNGELVKIEPFSIAIAEPVFSDLKKRIHDTRWPPASTAEPWSQGSDQSYLQRFLKRWKDDFDSSIFMRGLSQYNHFMAQTEGLEIHFLHIQAKEKGRIPLLLTHGWPSNFVEYLPVISLLVNPKKHGLRGDGFDLVIPSLPGYAFSTRHPKHTTRDTARIWNNLMNALGYSRFAVHGTDFGAGVSTFLALDFPESVIGLHLSNVENSPSISSRSAVLSKEEEDFLRRSEQWFEEEGAYKIIQRTKPSSLSFGLSDSPAGMAGWVLEKWRSWSDCDGDLDSIFDPDFLLSLLTIFWVTNSIGTAAMDYFDNKNSGYTLKEDEFVSTPTAIAAFGNAFVKEHFPPKEWVSRMYNVTRWTQMPKGGHFAAAEQPLLFCQDLLDFFAGFNNGSVAG